jgi:hypothetical protein
MPAPLSPKEHAHHAWRTAERVKRLSDRLVGIGPFGIGLDGVLAWVPVVGPLYSVAAGGLLLIHGVRGGAPPWTLARMAGYRCRPGHWLDGRHPVPRAPDGGQCAAKRHRGAARSAD